MTRLSGVLFAVNMEDAASRFVVIPEYKCVAEETLKILLFTLACGIAKPRAWCDILRVPALTSSAGSSDVGFVVILFSLSRASPDNYQLNPAVNHE